MRACSLGLATVIASASAPFAADVSADLVFCSRIADRAERMACYDAAARIAATRPQAVKTPAAAPATRRPSSRFHGPYMAVGGSYGAVTPQNALSGPVSPHGPSLAGAAGYNLVFGNMLFGTEIAGRLGAERATTAAANLFFGTFDTYSFTNAASIHASARAGFVSDDSLFFAKIGFGAVKVEMTSTTTFLTGATTRTHIEQWAPSLLLGAGIERNFGPWFARLGADLEMASTSFVNDQLWTARGSAMLGRRF